MRKLFTEITQEPFYLFFGRMIAEFSLRVAELAGVRSFLEIGAGRANLTGIMLEHLHERNKLYPLIVTDVQPIILENVGKLRDAYPQAQVETFLWNIMEPPPAALRAKLAHPVLLYERYTLNYATIKALEHIAEVADIVVLGDWFNYTGKLYAYDEVFKRIGANPLLYKEVKPLLDEYFPYQYIIDRRAQDAIKLPNITMLIAWK